MNGKSLVVGFLLGVLMAKAYTAQIVQLLLMGNTGYVYGSAVQGVQGQLLNAHVVVDHVQLGVGTALICFGVIITSLLWSTVESVAMTLVALVKSIKEVWESHTGEQGGTTEKAEV